MKSSFTKSTALGLSLVAMMFMASSDSNATVESTIGTVHIVEAILITEDDDMDFGFLNKPTGGTGTATLTLGTDDSVSYNANSTTGGGIQAGGAPTAADYTISASALTIDLIAAQTAADTGLSVGNFQGKYGTDPDADLTSGFAKTGVAAGSGGETLAVGADLAIGLSVGTGNQTVTYDLTVSYQ